jgi:arginine decarboxylase
VDAHAHTAHRENDRVEIDNLEGRVAAVLLTPYPPGIPLRAAAVAAGQG